MLSVLVETKLLLTDDCTGTRGLTVETNCSMWSVQNLMTVLFREESNKNNNKNAPGVLVPSVENKHAD